MKIKTKFNIIMALDCKYINKFKNYGIGTISGEIPWQLNPDMKRYRQLTENQNILMGFNTFQSLQKNYVKAFQNRTNYILTTKNIEKIEKQKNNLIFINDIQELDQKYLLEEVNCIGGQFVLQHIIQMEQQQKININKVYLTQLHSNKESISDVFIEKKYIDYLYENQYNIQQTLSDSQYSKNITYQYINIQRKQQNNQIQEKEQQNSFENQNNKNNEEQYLNLVKTVLLKGTQKHKNDNTISVFGLKMEFNIQNTFPLLTTKKMFIRGIFEELMWFLRGQTNNQILIDKGINIWTKDQKPKDNTILGPIYGHQWRYYGKEYKREEQFQQKQNIKYFEFFDQWDNKEKKENQQNKENKKYIDQIEYILNELTNNPFSRRAIINSWNPLDLQEMIATSLPPCHVLVQFHIKEKENGDYYLSSQLYQRSGDIGLGIPFNIASYSLLTYFIANELEKRIKKNKKNISVIPYKFIHIIGDSHIYLDHIPALQEQINRVPYPFPYLEFNKEKDFLDLEYSDIFLKNYVHHDKINMEMINNQNDNENKQ